MDSDIKKFIEACIIKGEAGEVGDSKTDNKQYKIINSVYILMKNSNRLDEFVNLLNHESPYVRLWASAYALQVTNSMAEEVLETLADFKGLLGFEAMMTLQEWRKGNLKF